MKLQVDVGLETDQTALSSGGVEARRIGPSILLLTGDPSSLALVLRDFWRPKVRGHRIDGTRNPPRTEESSDVPEGCVTVVDRHGVEHGPHCDDSDMRDWIQDKLSLINTQGEPPERITLVT